MAGFNILTVTQITSYLKSYIDENKKLSGEDVNETCASIKEDFKALIHTAVRVLEEEK